jgi:hypothetical protein
MVTHPALDLITMSLILGSTYIGWFLPSAANMPLSLFATLDVD